MPTGRDRDLFAEYVNGRSNWIHLDTQIIWDFKLSTPETKSAKEKMMPETLTITPGKFYKNRDGQILYVSKKNGEHNLSVSVLGANECSGELAKYGVDNYGKNAGWGSSRSLDIVSEYSPENLDPVIPSNWPEFTLGSDPEMILKYKTNFVSSVPWMNCSRDMGYGSFGNDGHDYTAEWRPAPSTTPIGMVEHLQQCFIQAVKENPGLAEMKWCAGSYKGGEPIGGHIHFGMGKEPLMCELLNRFLAAPFTLLEDPKEAVARKVKHSYGRLGDWREQRWGWEYRTLSASWIYSPTVALAVLSVAKHIINQFKIADNNILFKPKVIECLDTKINTEFQNHNTKFFREFHEKYWEEMMSWPMEPQLEHGITIFKQLIDEGYVIKNQDIKKNWGIKTNA